MKQISKFVDDKDGKLFDTAEECALYERDSDAHAILGLDVEEINTILDGDPREAERSMCIERLGTRLRRARQDRERAEKQAREQGQPPQQQLPPPGGAPAGTAVDPSEQGEGDD